MGGGDLNMKKHFHPLTMQNLERVWKAEQKAKEEAQKLEQLQKELEEERRREALQQHAVEQGILKKKNEKLDWMYAGPQVNHEEYLLGRKIDKSVEVLKTDEKEENEIGQSFVPEIADPVKDMAAKIKEDPLFLIRKKEDESKKELVQNPIKLRKLKEMLNLSVKEKKKHKKSKKNKKRKDEKEQKRRYISENNSDLGSGNEGKGKKYPDERYSYSERRREDSKDPRRKNGERRHEKRRRYNSESSPESESDNAARGIAKEEGRISSYARRNGRSSNEDRKYGSSMKSIKRRERSLSSSSDDSTGGQSRSRRHLKEERESKDHDKRPREKKALGVKGRDESHIYGRGGESIRKENGSGRSSFGRTDRVKDSDRERRRGKRDTSSDEGSGHERKKVKTANVINGDRRSGIENGREYGLVYRKGERPKGDSNGLRNENGDFSSKKASNFKTRHHSSPDSSPDRKQTSKRQHARGSGSDQDDKYRRKNFVKPPARMISNNISKKLSAEELEKKRLEMMENAKWRDDQRGKNVQKYKLEDENEEKEVRGRVKGSDEKAKFIHDLQVKSYSSSSTASVEDRIKRNIYTKQRTQSALNKKFTEK